MLKLKLIISNLIVFYPSLKKIALNTLKVVHLLSESYRDRSLFFVLEGKQSPKARFLDHNSMVMCFVFVICVFSTFERLNVTKKTLFNRRIQKLTSNCWQGVNIFFNMAFVSS